MAFSESEPSKNGAGRMVPFYAARVQDLKAGDFVVVNCACGHEAMIHPVMLPSLGLKPQDRILDLERRLRCLECNARKRWCRSGG
jgi:hypothetical protein